MVGECSRGDSGTECVTEQEEAWPGSFRVEDRWSDE